MAKNLAGRLNGKTALVTGGGSGIGRAASLAYAREGARVVVVDVNVEGGEETVQKIKGAGGDAILVHADVSKPEDTQAMVEQAVTLSSESSGYPPAGVYQIGDVQARSWMTRGMVGSSQVAGRASSGNVRHWRQLHRQLGFSTTRT